MGGSWLSGLTGRRRVSRQRECTKVNGRRIAAAAQTVVEHQQSGIGQAVGKLTEVLLQHEGLTGAGVSLLFGAEFQRCSLCGCIDFP